MQAQRNSLLDRVSGTATFRAIDGARVVTIEYDDRAFAFSGEPREGQASGGGGGSTRATRGAASLRDRLRQTRAHTPSEPAPKSAPEPSVSAAPRPPQVELDWDPEGPETEIDLDEVVRTMRIPRDRLAVDAPARDEESQVARVGQSRPPGPLLPQGRKPKRVSAQAEAPAPTPTPAPAEPSVRFSEEREPTRRTRLTTPESVPRPREASEEVLRSPVKPEPATRARETSDEYARAIPVPPAARSSSLPPPPPPARAAHARDDETRRLGRARRTQTMRGDDPAAVSGMPEPAHGPGWREPTQRTLHTLADDAARSDRSSLQFGAFPPVPQLTQAELSAAAAGPALHRTMVQFGPPHPDAAPSGGAEPALHRTAIQFGPPRETRARQVTPDAHAAAVSGRPEPPLDRTSLQFGPPREPIGRVLTPEELALTQPALREPTGRHLTPDVHRAQPTSRPLTPEALLGAQPTLREPSARSPQLTPDDLLRAQPTLPEPTGRARQITPDALLHAQLPVQEPTARSRQLTPDELLAQPSLREPTARSRQLTPDDLLRAQPTLREPTARSRQLTPDELLRAQPALREPTGRQRTSERQPPREPTSRQLSQGELTRAQPAGREPTGRQRTPSEPAPPQAPLREPTSRSRHVTQAELIRDASTREPGRALPPPPPVPTIARRTPPPPPPRPRTPSPTLNAPAATAVEEYDAMWDDVQPMAASRPALRAPLPQPPAAARARAPWQQKPWLIPAAASAVLALAGVCAAVALRGPASFELQVQFTPADAQVSVDGRLLAATSGQLHERLPLGRHALAVKKAGYVSEQRVITADQRGSVQQLQLRLSAEKHIAALSVSSIPSGAAIHIDGKDTGQTTPAALADIPFGAHAISLQLDGYAEAEQTVRLPEDALVSISLAPVAVKPPAPREVVRAPATPALPLTEALLARRAQVRAARAACRQNARNGEPFDADAEAVLRGIGESCLIATTPASAK